MPFFPFLPFFFPDLDLLLFKVPSGAFELSSAAALRGTDSSGFVITIEGSEVSSFSPGSNS